MSQAFLPVPITEERPWVVFAACRDADPALFFPEDGVAETAALVVCSGCPVQEQCLDYAIEAREPFGVWGGTSERGRRALLRRPA